MFFNPTIGTYQSRKMRKKRIKQVKTKSPMKILFLGLISKSPSYFIAECGLRLREPSGSERLKNAATPPQPSPLEASGSEEPLARRGEGEGGGDPKFIIGRLFPWGWGVRKEIPGWSFSFSPLIELL